MRLTSPKCCLFALFAALPAAWAQNSSVFPPEFAKVRTVAILNETRAAGVTDGATGELKDWGHWQVVEDPNSADLVLDFTKQKQHDGNSTNKPGDNGQQSYSYSMSFSSTIKMTATMKDAVSPFFSTATQDDKQKAGRECVQAFIAAYQSAQRRH